MQLERAGLLTWEKAIAYMSDRAQIINQKANNINEKLKRTNFMEIR